MTDVDVDVDMPEEQFAPNQQPEDPLPVNEGVDDMPEESNEEDAKVEMKIKEIVPDAEVFNDALGQAPPKRKKRPISEKQREHLAKIRIKAAEAKKAKRQVKSSAPKSAKKQYEEEVEEEYGSVNDMPEPQVEKDSSLLSLSPAQLRQLQYEAIYGYDSMRKARKEKKRKEQAKEKHEQQTFQAVSRAVNRPVDDDGWGVCFQ